MSSIANRNQEIQPNIMSKLPQSFGYC